MVSSRTDRLGIERLERLAEQLHRKHAVAAAGGIRRRLGPGARDGGQAAEVLGRETLAGQRRAQAVAIAAGQQLGAGALALVELALHQHDGRIAVARHPYAARREGVELLARLRRERGLPLRTRYGHARHPIANGCQRPSFYPRLRDNVTNPGATPRASWV